MKDAQRSEYIRSLDQLMTTSCILAGFAFSGLISLPGMEKELFQKIVDYFRGNFTLGFYVSFYALFFATLCFLKTIMTILVYKANSYKIPLKKLKNVHLVSNMVFSLAIASLLISVITFGVPHFLGIVGAFLVGTIVAGSFIWENMLPSQQKKREHQLQEETKKRIKEVVVSENAKETEDTVEKQPKETEEKTKE